MKKRVALLLAAVLLLSCAAGCGAPQSAQTDTPTAPPVESPEISSAPVDINEFIDTYKRADATTLETDPGKFLDDLLAVSGKTGSTDFSGWATSSEYALGDYATDTMLFNLPVTIEVTYSAEGDMKGGSISIILSPDDALATAKALCESALTKYGEADDIDISDVGSVSEHEWREKYINAGNYNLSWRDYESGVATMLNISAWAYHSELADEPSISVYIAAASIEMSEETYNDFK